MNTMMRTFTNGTVGDNQLAGSNTSLKCQLANSSNTINGSSVALGGPTTISTIEDQQLQLQVMIRT